MSRTGQGRGTARRARTAVVLGVALALLLPSAPAGAGSVEEARAEVAAAAARVALLQPRVDRALAAYREQLGLLASGVGRSISADQAADLARAEAEQADRQAGARVRALYMAGGASALVASVLSAPDAADAMRRVSYVRRLVEGGTATAETGAGAAARLARRAEALEASAELATVRAADVALRYDELAAALAAATAEVAALSDRARLLAEAQVLLDAVAALNAAVDATGDQRVAAARASGVPPAFRTLYLRAARTCQGMSWSLLAAVGQVESGHGANPGVSYAGAQGPMQFMPATFAAYGVDGDRDGDTDIQDPTDAVFSAARYLCANGAGRGGKALERAVWHYNHADWYVRLVLKLAAQYLERDGA